MDRILWSQGESPPEAAYFVIDGNPSRYCQDLIQNKAIRLIQSKKFKITSCHGENPNTTSAYKLKRRFRWICVEGNFNEIDDFGRNRVYSYAFRSHSAESLLNLLIMDARQIGCSIDSRDAIAIRKSINKRKKYKTLTWIITIMIVVVLLIITCLL